MFYSVRVRSLRGNVLPSTTRCKVVLHAVTLEIILQIAACIVIIVVVIIIGRITICIRVQSRMRNAA